MQRRSFLKKAAVGLAAGSIAAPAIAQSNPKISWRLAASWPKSLDTLFGGADMVAKWVGEMTDGNFQIRTFAGGEIVPGLQVLDAVQNGTVELGHTAPYYYIGKDLGFAFGTCVPFGMTDRQSNAWWHFGGGKEVMEPLFTEYGVKAILSGNTGTQMGGWFRKPIRSLADMKGLRFRIGGLGGRVIAKIGVVPTMVAGADIYPSLEKGTIDACEWVGPYDDEKLGFQKVAKYYYSPGWWEGGPRLMTLVNLKKWAELPKHYQAALETACHAANEWMMAKYDHENPKALRRLIAGGTQLRYFPKSVMQASEKGAYALYKEYMGKSKHWARIYPQWLAYRDQEIEWHRFNDSTYQNYLWFSKIKAKA
jgi:TRAP-type mannitol/chloroaromatic compound transport system substrate-binding protein